MYFQQVLSLKHKNRILVTGANGYIGLHVSKKLIDLGYEVVLTDIQSDSLIKHKNYFQEDFLNPKKIKHVLKQVKYVFFFTGVTGPADESIKNPGKFIEGNEINLTNLLKEISVLKEKPRVIFPSTRLVYKGLENKSISEDSELQAKTVYAVNKIACENYLDLYHRCFGIDYTILRISLPYGSQVFQENLSHGVMSKLINSAKNKNNLEIYGKGNQKGSFIHISDLTNVIIKVSFLDSTRNNIYNAPSGNILSMKDVIVAIAIKYGVDAVNTPWPEISLFAEHGDIIFDSSKLNKIIKYECQYDFYNWLEQT